MPLPPALQARLQRRGLVTKEESKPASQPTLARTPAGEEVEEVFAEDYDEPNKNEAQLPEPTSMVMESIPMPLSVEDDNSPLIHEVPNCPNRSNKYHTCVDWCKKHWGMKIWDPDSEMIRKRDRMLRKYPLPTGWEEVADSETNRYFYWNTITDEVSWLSPVHPKAHLTLSAETLRRMEEAASQPSSQSDSEEDDDEDEEEDMDVNDSESNSSSSSSDEEEYDRRRGGRRDNRDRGDTDRGRGRSSVGRGAKRTREEFDPMDPSSYSDVPRGGWSSGLETRGDAKTGVDSTASGPLFQQRPYPSPGAILRANKTPKPS